MIVNMTSRIDTLGNGVAEKRAQAPTALPFTARPPGPLHDLSAHRSVTQASLSGANQSAGTVGDLR